MNANNAYMKTFFYPAGAILTILILLCTEGCRNETLSSAHTTTEASFSFEPAAGTVVWWSKDNTPQQRELTAGEAAAGSVTLTVQKEGVTPVMLYQKDVVEPAGCIWPVSTSITEKGGFCSRILWRLLTETDNSSGPPEAIKAYCGRFNWKRFCDEVETIENPWELNQQKILKAVADGTFTMKCLK